MLVAYIIFFGIINFLILELLSEERKTSLKVRIIISSIAILVLVLHLLNVFQSAISNEIFFILLIFNLYHFICFFGFWLALGMSIHKAIIIRDRGVDHLIYFMTFYINYFLIYIFQIVTLVNNSTV